MKVIISSSGDSIDSSISPVFGRTEYYLLVDTEDLTHESFVNPASSQSSGAGIQAAQFVLKKDPGSVISSSIGPNAYEVLTAGSVPCYTASGGTIRETIMAFNQGDLPLMGAANANSHSGVAVSSASPAAVPVSETEELEFLSEKLRDLRGQVADVLQKLDSLREGQE